MATTVAGAMTIPGSALRVAHLTYVHLAQVGEA